MLVSTKANSQLLKTATKATDKNSDSLTNRYAYAGLGGTFGEVTYGKNDGALGVITDFTDIMAYHGNSAAMKINAADRADNMLSYKGQFQDLSVKASYRFADRTELKADGTPAGEGDAVASYSDNSADGYSLSGIYAIGETGVKLGAGYASQYSGDASTRRIHAFWFLHVWATYTSLVYSQMVKLLRTTVITLVTK